jgi:hypothetical protein
VPVIDALQFVDAGSEDLRANYTQDAKLGFVVNAIYTMAYALHAMQRDMCGPNHPGLCDAMSPVNGTLFLDYLLNASFKSYSSDIIEFDRAGDPPGRSVYSGRSTQRFKSIVFLSHIFLRLAKVIKYRYMTFGHPIMHAIKIKLQYLS